MKFYEVTTNKNMCNWNVYIFASTLLLLVFCDGKLPEQYKIDVYSTYDDDVERFKLVKLKGLIASLKELYDICYNNANKMYQITSDLLDLYDQAEGSFKQVQRVYNCIDRELAQDYDSCVSKEKQMIESVNTIVTTTCYKDLQDWARITKQNCINAIRQDNCCNRIKSDYAQMRSLAGQLKSYLYNENGIKENLSNRRTNVLRGVIRMNKSINITVHEYVDQLLKMKLMKMSSREVERFNHDFIENVRIVMPSEIEPWDQDLRYTRSSVKKQHDELNYHQNECDATKKRLQACLKATERTKVTVTQQMVHDFLNGQIFLVQDDSLVEVDCEDHVPFYGSTTKERLHSAETNEDDAEVWHIEGKNENNESYKRTLVAKFVENEQVELHETIIYSNSDIAPVDNKYIIKFKKVL